MAKSSETTDGPAGLDHPDRITTRNAKNARKAAPSSPPVEALRFDATAKGSDVASVEKDASSTEDARHRMVTIGLVRAGLSKFPQGCGVFAPPVDAISVGHYLGVKPQQAERALDFAISRSRRLSGKVTKPCEPLLDTDLLLTQFTDRGTIRGALGELFFLPDPRTDEGPGPADPESDGTDRVIVIAGMGMPSTFGMPELIVLARELSWALGRMGKRHLATVLIGTGVGNLSIPSAISAWLRGVARTIDGSPLDEGRLLQRITFVEHNPNRVLKIDKAIRDELVRLAEEREWFRKQQGRDRSDVIDRVPFDYTPLDDDQRCELTDEVKELERTNLEARLAVLNQKTKPPDEGLEPTGTATGKADPIPARATVVREETSYRFGAITQAASIPEREIALDPMLVEEANDELIIPIDTSKVEGRDYTKVVNDALARQLERGRFVGELLVPDDLRKQLAPKEPLVLMLDATTARIHWEMVAIDRPTDATQTIQPVLEDHRERFLSTSRSLTRQLRTTFAPPPEPPPPPRRLLRVLVVANPAPDKYLPNATEEGREVKKLFEAFNKQYGKPGERWAEVVFLRGRKPGQEVFEREDEDGEETTMVEEATRTNVLRHLMVYRPFDVLHYTGHCYYNKEDPSASGWLFGEKKYLTARELSRIDCIPKFVFSNACESGITPDRARKYVGLGPSFAESFFARGVASFIGTGWPVDDYAGSLFVRKLYAALLGLKPTNDGKNYEKGEFLPMHEAMRQARIAITETAAGVATWGAYQHYGDPFFKLFDPKTMD
jgi:CHAT domain